MNYSVLLIDDDPDFSSALAKRLTQSGGLEIVRAFSASQGLDRLKSQDIDLVLLDIGLPDQSGMGLVKTIRAMNPSVPVIMVSAYGEPNYVVQAIQAGANDYLPKPVDFAKLSRRIRELLKPRDPVRFEKGEPDGEGAIIGDSPAMRQLLLEIGQIARSDAPVLLHGESGTGKSVLAEAIHRSGRRKPKPFVTINCPAIPSNLLESELFGHQKGSFTGAIRDKEGKFEMADGGTIFLDEIGELPFDLQAKILRVLQTGAFERIGGLKTIRVDVRVISATNRDLREAIRARDFREDLFYRLNVLPLSVPPLRERKADLAPLVAHFVRRCARKMAKEIKPLTEEVLAHLASHDWPGNIRELQNVVERAVILCAGDRLLVGDFRLERLQSLPEGGALGAAGSGYPARDAEYLALLAAIREGKGNITRMAQILGVARGAVYRRLKKYNISHKTLLLEKIPQERD